MTSKLQSPTDPGTPAQRVTELVDKYVGQGHSPQYDYWRISGATQDRIQLLLSTRRYRAALNALVEALADDDIPASCGDWDEINALRDTYERRAWALWSIAIGAGAAAWYIVGWLM